MPVFQDLVLTIANYTDQTKHFHFNVGTLNTNTEFTAYLPVIGSASATMPFLELAQTWTDVQTFDDIGGGNAVLFKLNNAASLNSCIFVASDVAGGGTVSVLFPSGQPITSNYLLTLPAATCTLAALDLNQQWSGLQSFEAGIQLGFSGSPGSIIVFYDNASGTFTGALDGTGISTNQSWALPDASGALALTDTTTALRPKVDVTAHAADITSTALTSVAGQYRVSYILEDTTAAVGAGAVTLTLAWTDDAGATTATATQVLTSTGRTPGVVTLYLASGSLTYAVSHTGIFSTSQYALRLRLEYLG